MGGCRLQTVQQRSQKQTKGRRTAEAATAGWARMVEPTNARAGRAQCPQHIDPATTNIQMQLVAVESHSMARGRAAHRPSVGVVQHAVSTLMQSSGWCRISSAQLNSAELSCAVASPLCSTLALTLSNQSLPRADSELVRLRPLASSSGTHDHVRMRAHVRINRPCE